MERTITPEELKKNASNFAVIDVRRKDDYDGETILDAEWHDPEKISEWAKELPADKEVILYCARGGSVSNRVLDALLAEKIKARYIEGGIEGWRKSGGPVTRK